MSLPRQYSRTLRNHLRCHAVWPPTTAVAPGDYGEFVGGIWKRIGNITVDFDVPVAVEPGGSRAERFLYHSDAGTGAHLDVGAALAGLEAELDISLERRTSFFISVAGFDIDRLASVRQVATRLRERPGWRHLRYFVVSELLHGHDLLFYGSESGSAGVKVRGETEELKLFRDVGRLSPALSFSSRGEVGLQVRGAADVPTGFGINLFRVRAIGADPMDLSFGGPVDDDPVEHLEDDAPEDAEDEPAA